MHILRDAGGGSSNTSVCALVVVGKWCPYYMLHWQAHALLLISAGVCNLEQF